jgi:hypothetical protein
LSATLTTDGENAAGDVAGGVVIFGLKRSLVTEPGRARDQRRRARQMRSGSRPINGARLPRSSRSSRSNAVA